MNVTITLIDKDWHLLRHILEQHAPDLAIRLGSTAEDLRKDIARLEDALHQCLAHIEADEATHGRAFAAGNVARKSLRTVEGVVGSISKRPLALE
jgi:hypothetical protein